MGGIGCPGGWLVVTLLAVTVPVGVGAAIHGDEGPSSEEPGALIEAAEAHTRVAVERLDALRERTDETAELLDPHALLLESTACPDERDNASARLERATRAQENLTASWSTLLSARDEIALAQRLTDQADHRLRNEGAGNGSGDAGETETLQRELARAREQIEEARDKAGHLEPIVRHLSQDAVRWLDLNRPASYRAWVCSEDSLGAPGIGSLGVVITTVAAAGLRRW